MDRRYKKRREPRAELINRSFDGSAFCEAGSHFVDSAEVMVVVLGHERNRGRRLVWLAPKVLIDSLG